MRTPDPTAPARRIITGNTATPEQRAVALATIADNRTKTDAVLAITAKPRATIAGSDAEYIVRKYIDEDAEHRGPQMTDLAVYAAIQRTVDDAMRVVADRHATPEQRDVARGVVAANLPKADALLSAILKRPAPINTPRSEAALSTIAGHHALHARHVLAESGRHREAPMAVDVPDDPPPLVVFRPVRSMSARIKRWADWASGAVLLIAIGWIGGIVTMIYMGVK